jgi:hypothetical protein
MQPTLRHTIKPQAPLQPLRSASEQLHERQRRLVVASLMLRPEGRSTHRRWA